VHDITKIEDLGVNYKDKTATEEVWDLDNPTISITVKETSYLPAKETYLFTSKRDGTRPTCNNPHIPY